MADIFNMADTWNAGATTFTALKMNVTDTASAAASLLMDLQVGGVSKINGTKTGNWLVGAGTQGAPSLANTVYANLGFYFPTATSIGVVITGTEYVRFGSADGILMRTDFVLGWVNGNIPGGTRDLSLYRDAANILAQRNGVNAQTLRWYHTWTDASNKQNGALKTAAGYVEIAAETAGTGADDIDVLLTPAGVGNVRFGTYAALGAEVVSGFITIKDAGGTSRKIAVVA